MANYLYTIKIGLQMQNNDFFLIIEEGFDTSICFIVINQNLVFSI